MITITVVINNLWLLSPSSTLQTVSVPPRHTCHPALLAADARAASCCEVKPAGQPSTHTARLRLVAFRWQLSFGNFTWKSGKFTQFPG